MRIGIMLRTMDEKQGIGIYTQNLMDRMLALDRENEFVLFYRNPDFIGRYRQYANVKEKLVRAGNKLVWDQVMMPREVRRERIDVLFHTKFTVPLLARCKTVMSIHGASWFVRPELYTKWDVRYIKAVMPLYCRKADFIVSNSDLTTHDYIRILKVRPDRIKTVHLGRNENFRIIGDQAERARIRQQYNLPEKFIFSVVKYDPRKNFRNLIAGFRLLRKQTPCKLVVAGIGCEKYREEYGLDKDGTADDVSFLGWVEQKDLPAIYNLARCMLFPSVYEEFGIPTCEAMACGCPPVVSNTGALPEIAGDAGILVDPFNPEDIARGLMRVWNDDAAHAEIKAKALARAEEFTWDRCARETLDIIRKVGAHVR